MKFSTLILLLLISQFILSQGNNVISVRKVKYDTTFYSETKNDTLLNFTTNSRKINPFEVQNNLNGIWNKNVLFTKDTFYVFSSWISNRMASLALKNPDKFWKKINRRVSKKKIHVFSSNYRFNETITEQTIRTFTLTYFTISNPETGEVIRNNRELLDSSLSNTTKFSRRKYSYSSFYDSIQLGGRAFNFTSLCNDDRCLFRSLLGSLEASYRRNQPFGYFKSGNKVARDSYEFYFNFENFLINKAILVKNREEKYYCSFTMKNDSLLFTDSPVPEFNVGRVDRKKRKIRFRYNNQGYNFYLKSPLLTTGVFRSHPYYYTLPLAN